MPIWAIKAAYGSREMKRIVWVSGGRKCADMQCADVQMPIWAIKAAYGSREMKRMVG
jgi:hypothetical protein